MDVTAENIANVSTTKTDEGGPYERKLVLLEAKGEGPTTLAPPSHGTLPLAAPEGAAFQGMLPPARSREEVGVDVQAIERDRTEGPRVYDPGHPHADAEGYVRYPNVELAMELLTLQSAARAYEANLAVLRTTQEAARETLRIGR
jgi:flagellar basal-body rod protein FlgC